VLDDDAKVIPTDEHLDACLAAGAPLVWFSFGDPTDYVDRVHGAGADVAVTVADEQQLRSRVTCPRDESRASEAALGGPTPWAGIHSLRVGIRCTSTEENEPGVLSLDMFGHGEPCSVGRILPW